MIRRACYAVLLTYCAATMAEPLYQWTEADGSITFSPDKPPAGIDFKIIEPRSGNTSPGAEQATVPVLAASAIENTRTRPPVTSHRAPLRSGNTSVESGSVSWSGNVQQPTKRALPSQNVSATKASNARLGRCEDLRKRVVSLERRLKANLSPEDMDNTVVYMSRYQRSYDKFCVQ